jgi:hypothetical protein
MQTYEHLVEMARICAKNAHIASSKEIAAELWKTATEYRDKAANLHGGAAPDIGQPPYWLPRSGKNNRSC